MLRTQQSAMGQAGIGGLDGRGSPGQPSVTIKSSLSAFQTVAVKILKFPVACPSPCVRTKASSCRLPSPAHAIGHRHLLALPPRGSALLKAHSVQEQ
jgi:hypothetical protein